MTRPETVQDVFALVQRSRLVADAKFTGFLGLLQSAGLTGAADVGTARLTPAGVLGLLVEQGLLTRYQADQLAAGRWEFWIGGYRILDQLGRGGMGTVFLAEHPLLGKRVAVKILTDGLQADRAAHARFLREARASASVDHPNIVQIYHADVDHDPPFLVMEYVDGISLQAAVARHGVFAPGETAAVGVSVARGLAAVAAVGLVHRDIKPANLLIDRKGQLKILDLGIARFSLDPDPRGSEPDVILGTPDYLAPEQAIDSRTVDHRADQYALGATLYFLLAGHPPFPDTDVARKLQHKQTTDPPSLHQVRSDVSPELAAVIARLLARAPADRFATPTEAAEALQRCADPGPDFPARLFRPWQPTATEPVEQPTEPLRGRDLTPLPITRRLNRPQFVVNPTPTADTPTDPIRRDVPDAAEVNAEATATENGPRTIPLLTLMPPPVAEVPDRRRGWLWPVLVVLIALAAILVLVAILV